VYKRQLQCSAQNVSDVLNSSIVVKEVKRLQEMRDGDAVDMTARIAELAPVAVEVLEDSMEKEHDAKIRLIAAKDVLDRSGYTPAKRVEMKGVIGHVTVEDIAEITRRAQLAHNVVDDTDETSVEVVEEVTDEVQDGETTQ